MASVKAALKIEADDASEAALLTAYRAAALDWVERYTALSLAQRAWTATFDGFVEQLRLPRGPVVAVTALGYRGVDGTAVALTGTDWRLSGDVLAVAAGRTWPLVLAGTGAVTVTFNAGFAAVATEAPGLIAAALMIVGHLYRNRETVVGGTVTDVPFGAKALCDLLRVPVIG